MSTEKDTPKPADGPGLHPDLVLRDLEAIVNDGTFTPLTDTMRAVLRRRFGLVNEDGSARYEPASIEAVADALGLSVDAADEALERGLARIRIWGDDGGVTVVSR